MGEPDGRSSHQARGQARPGGAPGRTQRLSGWPCGQADREPGRQARSPPQVPQHRRLPERGSGLPGPQFPPRYPREPDTVTRAQLGTTSSPRQVRCYVNYFLNERW